MVISSLPWSPPIVITCHFVPEHEHLHAVRNALNEWQAPLFWIICLQIHSHTVVDGETDQDYRFHLVHVKWRDRLKQYISPWSSPNLTSSSLNSYRPNGQSVLSVSAQFRRNLVVSKTHHDWQIRMRLIDNQISKLCSCTLVRSLTRQLTLALYRSMHPRALYSTIRRYVLISNETIMILLITRHSMAQIFLGWGKRGNCEALVHIWLNLFPELLETSIHALATPLWYVRPIIRILLDSHACRCDF